MSARHDRKIGMGREVSIRQMLVLLCCVLAGAAFAISAQAQDRRQERHQTRQPLKVVTTFTIIQDMARQIAGDAAIVESLTKPGAEIHDYAPSPRDVVKAQSADLVLWNGLNLERWFERFFDNVSNVRSVVVSEGIVPLSIYEGAYKDKPNPHAWMSPTNGLIYVENIRKALVEADPANAETYNKNAEAYARQIRAVYDPLRARIDALAQERRWLVTSEGAFSYLARDFGLREAYLWPINADEQGTPQQVRQVIDLMRKNNIPVIFSESTISDKPARQVAKEAGARYGGVLYVDSLSGPDGPVPNYIRLLQVTGETIVKGLES